MSKFSFIKDKIKLNIKPKKGLVLKQISLLLVTAVLFVFAVWAWFVSESTPAEASGINITMTTANNLQISLDDGTHFRSSIDLMSESDQEFISIDNVILNRLDMKDLTSDGKTFFRPVFNDDENANRIPDVSQNWDEVTGDGTVYISEKIVFRTAIASDIYISENTNITTSAESAGLLLTNTAPVNIGNMSDFGYFSKDCIVGALRISATTSSGELCYVSIPRADVELTKTTSTDGTKYTVNTGDSVSVNAKAHNYYATSGATGNTEVLYTLTESDKVIDFSEISSSPIATTTLQENGFYEATATVNIWLEGCDSETTRALSGGQYTIYLDFAAVKVEADTTLAN